MSLHDIKDTAPNQATIEQLEKALAQAKSGELRSVLIVKGWNDDTVCHTWSLDERSNRRMILSDVVMAQHNLAVKLAVDEGDSVLAGLLD